MTGKLGMLQSMGSQRAGHDLATEQQQKQQPTTKGQQGLLGVSRCWHRKKSILL